MATYNPCNLPHKHYDKLTDPYSFVKVEDFFSALDSRPTIPGLPPSNEYNRISDVELYPGESESQKDLILHHAAAFRDLDNHKIFVIQFIRPTVWRLRFNPQFSSVDEYSDGNTRNMVQDTMTKLISTLDRYEGTHWEVHVEEIVVDGVSFTKIESRPTEPAEDDKFPYFMRIYVRMKNLQILAVRPTKRYIGRDDVDPASLGINSTQGDVVEQVVWRSKTKGILYNGKTTVIETRSEADTAIAASLGFGEQGGRGLLKTKAKLDYFTYDNMKYSQIYGQGPLDSREPLYHSEPFWMEISQHPGYLLKVANFVDNYSQVYLDIGSKDNSSIRVSTRIGTMQLCIVVGDHIGEVIRSYTSIVGRPYLKPRYVLGHHQGCYGYESDGQIRDVVKNYQDADFPLDGMHVDVDIQREYKTFTINKDKFPDPAKFFKDLRLQGVKCSTNITPFINGQPDPEYKTLNEALKHGFFVKDLRHTEEGGPVNAHHDVYMVYEWGKGRVFRADDLNQEPRQQLVPPDNVTWNTGEPFRGGVYYGEGRGKVTISTGKPGHYPDLNRSDVRLWWGKQYNDLIEWGLEFVWQDMTSPCMGLSYGDMKGFPFRLLLTSDGIKGLPALDRKAPAMEIWALYAFNLHKATFHGWNRNPLREGKRNFIIGRGGFIGLHRHAGLWTGDNSSDWDFLKVSVAQILSLGLSGITISGGDVGGFELSRKSPPDWQKWAHPELLMRWYCAYSLLPWFRYIEALDNPNVPKSDEWLYRATLPICRYFVRLRYTLLQLLYDQMFDNLTTGLPIARALIISNEDDPSLVSENTEFLDDEYMVGDHLLVAPVLDPQGDGPKQATRVAYLPRPDPWWLFNLRADGPQHAVPLTEEFVGGSLVPVNARLELSEEKFPLMTPMFVKSGGIIPQIEPRLHVEDLDVEPNVAPNPITVHVYPGYDGLYRTYAMYLDDGVSRNSAPTAHGLQTCWALNQNNIALVEDKSKHLGSDAFGDTKAADVYWRIKIQQASALDTKCSGEEITRTVSVQATHTHTGYNPTRRSGPNLKFIIWGEPRRASTFSAAKVTVPVGAPASPQYDSGRNAWLLELPFKAIGEHAWPLPHLEIKCVYRA
ncbi:hypothetical protein FRC07_014945 [Ceratobasidium sp. 392]|nr:hypothetical protein FRC07_014945 [Ceratobasidium sp. 392]